MVLSIELLKIHISILGVDTMKLNEINKVIKKVSEELTNINKKYNTDINIFLRITEVITMFYLLIMDKVRIIV